MVESISNNSSSSASYDVHSISQYSDKGAQQAVREITDMRNCFCIKDQTKEGILKYLLKPVIEAKSFFEQLKSFFLIKSYGVNVTHKGNTDMVIPFIKVMQLFGYAVDKKGICFSIAGGAGRSCIRKGVPEFIKRMELICAINEAAHKAGYIPRTEETEETEEERKARETIKDKVIGELLSDRIYREDGHQLLNFFDEMSVSDNYISEEWQKALGHIGIKDLEEARWESDGDALESRELYLKECFITYYNFFAKNKLQNFLQKLRDDNGDKPWHVMIYFPTHACSIGFDGLKFLVSNHDRQTYTDNISGAMHLIRDYSRFGVKRVCLQIFGAKEDDLSIDQAKKVLSDVQITEKKVLKDELPVAAKFGATETVKSLLQKILSEKQKSSVDMPESIFPCNGYIQKIKQFLQQILQRILALFQKEQSQAQKKQSQAELLKEYRDCINACMSKAWFCNKPQIMQVCIQTIVTEIDNTSLSHTEKKELLRKFLFGEDELPVLNNAFKKNRFKVAKVYIHTVMSAIENTLLPLEHKRELQMYLLGKDGEVSLIILNIIQSKSFKYMDIYVEAIWAAVQDLQWSDDEKRALLTELLVNTGCKRFPKKELKSYIRMMIPAIQNLTMSAEEKETLQLELFMVKGQDPDQLPLYDFILYLNDEEMNKLFFSVISADQLDKLASEKWSIDYLREAHKKATEEQ